MVCWYLVFELHEKNDLPIYIYIYTLGNLLNNVCCENKNIKNKFLNKRYFATYVAFSSSHGGLYIYIHVNMFYLVLFINTDTLEQCI